MTRGRAGWPSVDTLLASAGEVQRASILAARDRPVVAPRVARVPAEPERPAAPSKPKGRQPNKTERAWMDWLAMDPSVKRVVYEGVTLRLADGLRYTPDCYVEFNDGTLGLDECKGAFVRDTARVKFEWARQQFPGFRWRWCQRIKGKWHVSEQAGKARLSTGESGEAFPLGRGKHRVGGEAPKRREP